MAKRVEGDTVIVTGAAQGIGKATAQRLAAEGAAVVVADIDDQGGQVADGIVAGGGRARYAPHDVTDERSWIDLVATTLAHEGRLDGLVNSAGIAWRAPLAAFDLGDWNRVMAVNASGAFLGMKHCLPVIADREGGSVVNLASVAAPMGVPSYTAYSASKGAVLSMTRVAAMEYAHRGVRVNAVLPGNTDTAMARYDAEYVGVSPEQFAQGAAKIYPLGRMADPEDDIAPVVLFLISDDARYVTGVHLPVDGGLSAGTANG